MFGDHSTIKHMKVVNALLIRKSLHPSTIPWPYAPPGLQMQLHCTKGDCHEKDAQHRWEPQVAARVAIMLGIKMILSEDASLWFFRSDIYFQYHQNLAFCHWNHHSRNVVFAFGPDYAEVGPPNLQNHAAQGTAKKPAQGEPRDPPPGHEQRKAPTYNLITTVATLLSLLNACLWNGRDGTVGGWWILNAQLVLRLQTVC